MSDYGNRRTREAGHGGSAFMTMFGGSLGCFAAVAFILVAGCGGILFVASLGKKAREQEQQHSESPSPEKIKDIALKEEVSIGDVTVSIGHAQLINHYESRSPSGQLHATNDPVVMVWISLKNQNPRKNASIGGQTGKCKLQDDVGNTYRDLETKNQFGVRCVLIDQIPAGMAIELRSDKTGEDRLIFDQPVPAAGQLTLTISAEPYGGAGWLRVKIPKKVWNPTKGKT